MASSQDIVPSNQPENSGSSNVSDVERWGSLISGGAMVLMGLRQRSLRGALMAIAGGSLVYHGAKADKSIQDTIQEKAGMSDTIKVEKTVTINKPADELYRFWHNFENLPNFMKHLKSVTVYNETRSHWIANAPLGASVEWDADIINQKENEFIAWASAEDADIDNSGFVRFTPAPNNRGTEVKVVIEYNPPGGAVGVAIAKLFGEAPQQQIGDDLRRFKMLMEAGEIATTEGQPSGRS
ncbi:MULTISPECIES: SRPBCC family protein [Cyanophyceae]|uniref:SRPBCC family protein n=1 Tax=Cyanophyceae TaxID=3028117 RepID=UPI0016869295|nr:SRPBCC family protein [Trichocoleus sp. FACHB-40]MBD2006730.1 SRPBCC family protein [Trichocoleus sp. FACHB-40]